MQAHQAHFPNVSTYFSAAYAICRDAIDRVRSGRRFVVADAINRVPTYIFYQLIISTWLSVTTMSGRVSSIYRCTCVSTLSTCWLLLLTQLTPGMAMCQLSCSSTSAIATSNWLRTRAIKDLITWRLSFKERHPGSLKVIWLTPTLSCSYYSRFDAVWLCLLQYQAKRC